jgi:calcium-dependent protein kinase
MLANTILPRPTAAEVLNHPWTQHRSKTVNYTKPLAEKAFKNLKMYSTSSKMQQAILQHITNTQLTKDERDAIAVLFTQMDKDSSGFLTSAELKAGLSSGGLEMSDEEVDRLLDRLDSNHTGVINYSEFVTGVAERTNLLAKERLNALFASLDTDGSGDITAAELKAAMGGSEEAWLPLLAQVDSNKDGKVDAREFKEMLLSFSN